MAQAYSDPARETDPHALPDIEVFELTAAEVAESMEDEIWEFTKRPKFRLATMSGRTRETMLDAMVVEFGIEGGWFWQSCFAGCLPDSSPMGPFASYREALADAQSSAEEA